MFCLSSGAFILQMEKKKKKGKGSNFQTYHKGFWGKRLLQKGTSTKGLFLCIYILCIYMCSHIDILVVGLGIILSSLKF